jgi:hypothetical protein
LAQCRYDRSSTIDAQALRSVACSNYVAVGVAVQSGDDGSQSVATNFGALVEVHGAVVRVGSAVELMQPAAVVAVPEDLHYASAETVTINHGCVRLLPIDEGDDLFRELHQVQAAVFAQGTVLTALAHANDAAVVSIAGNPKPIIMVRLITTAIPAQPRYDSCTIDHEETSLAPPVSPQ